MAARSAELSAQARRIAGFVSGTSCTMYLQKVGKSRRDMLKLDFKLELGDNSIAGSGPSQCEEQVVAVRVDDSARCGGENLIETSIKFSPRIWRCKKFFFRGLVKKTTFFGNFSQIAGPPPYPPFWEILFTKKF